MEREVFSQLPLLTWRWLGVNEAFLPEALQGQVNINKKRIHVGAGRTQIAIIVYRAEQLAEVQAEVEEGGTLKLICVQLLPTDTAHAGSISITAGKDAKIYVTAVEAGASYSVTKLQVDLLGDGSAADVAAVYFGDQARKLDLNYVINQIGKNTDANMQVRGALQDASDKIFRGTLDFRRGSKGSSGREREEVILFNEGVRNRSVPLMLSSEDEVTGHHAVSAGRMNREKLFYLMSRGLDEKEARKLLAQAMLTPVLERIPDIALQEEITDNIEERISDGQS
ncbi:MAG: SufD family Fe-S cluster assembly protein [Acidaminococcaceae bacterium]|nr:SufD family Fe-S cluster assembly protein [Acidaminococcaceae bacterium]